MQYSFAPLEGITDSVFRRLHHQFFGGMDRYYMPFISPTQHHSLTVKEKRELPLADSLGFSVIPQVLTKSAEDFLWAAEKCAELGYPELNLNLGCPSGTVVSKGKGSGMLRDPDALRAFLDAVVPRCPVRLSVKTRLGIYEHGEFPELLQIYNGYPLAEVILHPRVREDFYKGPIDLEAFAYAMEHSKNPLCYNGDVCSLKDVQTLTNRFPGLSHIMVGRALVGNPGMLLPNGTQRRDLLAFHAALLEEYLPIMGSKRNMMFRLKEHWRYLLCLFDCEERLGKKLMKTTDYDEFCTITQEILKNAPILSPISANWTKPLFPR